MAQFKYTNKYLVKISFVDKPTSYGVSRAGLVPSPSLSSISLTRSDGMVTFKEGSKVALSQSCKSHMWPEIKRFSSELVMDFSSREANSKDF